MHLPIVTETYTPRINGVARTLAQMVSGLTERGHRVTLVRPTPQLRAPKPGAAQALVEVRGISLHGLPGPSVRTAGRSADP